MKEYTFDFDIQGSATIVVDAESIDDALDKLKSGNWKEDQLSEWDYVFPRCEDEYKSCWSNRCEFKD
jgi:hypothetical protein